MREHIVTLYRHDDLEDFYKDIETPGGLYIPNRTVEVVNRRPSSRNTHYLLTDAEAAIIRIDPRVEHVSLSPSELNVQAISHYVATSDNWDKSALTNITMVNWGLLRCTLDQNIDNWGSDGFASVSGTINVQTSGKNVDIVIVDQISSDTHPEYADRLIRYNWFQHNEEVWPTNPISVYDYGTVINNHATHTSGTAAGSTQGWARDATLYNLNYENSNVPIEYLIDYLRAFHKNKPINPSTGIRNPTVCNNSWGYGISNWASTYIEDITSITHNGTTHFPNGVFTVSQLVEYGLIDSDSSSGNLPVRIPSLDADVIDAISEGIIFVASAGNDGYKIDIPGGVDYDNYIVLGGDAYHYHRGSSPGASPGAICVGAIGTSKTEEKADYSNTGPRVNLYAPGSNIMSSVNSGGVTNGRGLYKKYSGTSMSSPQVSGVLACWLETYPRMTQNDALSMLIAFSNKDKITETGSTYFDTGWLQGGNNYYLHYVKLRDIEGVPFPKHNNKARPALGMIYPRPNIYRAS